MLLSYAQRDTSSRISHFQIKNKKLCLRQLTMFCNQDSLLILLPLFMILFSGNQICTISFLLICIFRIFFGDGSSFTISRIFIYTHSFVSRSLSRCLAIGSGEFVLATCIYFYRRIGFNGNQYFLSLSIYLSFQIYTFGSFGVSVFQLQNRLEFLLVYGVMYLIQC